MSEAIIIALIGAASVIIVALIKTRSRQPPDRSHIIEVIPVQPIYQQQPFFSSHLLIFGCAWILAALVIVLILTRH